MGGRSRQRAEQRAWAGSMLGGFEVRQERRTGTEWARVGRRGESGRGTEARSGNLVSATVRASGGSPDPPGSHRGAC